MLTQAPNTVSRLYYQLPQPWDTATYYVRAVVKDLLTNESLGTYDLDSLGSQAFSKEWTTPADNNGQGRTLVVTFTVYEDSGYTQPSPNYGTQAEYFNIYQPWTQVLGNIGGGSVDYKEIRQIVDAAIEKHEKNRKPDPKIVQDLQSLKDQIKVLKDQIVDLKKSDTEVHSLLDSIPKSLEKIDAKIEKNRPDLSGISSEVGNIRKQISSLGAEVKLIELKNSAASQEGFRRMQNAVLGLIPEAVRNYINSLTPPEKAPAKPSQEAVIAPNSPKEGFLQQFLRMTS